MPSNPEKDNHKARKMVDKIMMDSLPNISEGVHIKEIIRQVVLSYAVTPTSVKRFIQEFYVDLGYATLKEDILFYKGDSDE